MIPVWRLCYVDRRADVYNVLPSFWFILELLVSRISTSLVDMILGTGRICRNPLDKYLWHRCVWTPAGPASYLGGPRKVYTYAQSFIGLYGSRSYLGQVDLHSLSPQEKVTEWCLLFEVRTILVMICVGLQISANGYHVKVLCDYPSG